MNSINTRDVVYEVSLKLNLSAADTATLFHDVNNFRGGEWLKKIESIGDDNLTARFKIAANIIDEPDETDGEYDDYPTEQKYFVYDKDDNCVSDGFNFEDGAIAFANSCGHTIVKIHRYYRDPTRGYKLYPDGYPETVWKRGSPV
jgi:hypothetical protein